VATLVEQMLQDSDNVIAEVLARQVAIADNQPPSFVGAAAAVAATDSGLGVEVGAGMVDASGLSALDRVPAAALAAALMAAVGTAHPALHAILAGLPVAGWDGTLSDRFTAATDPGRGIVRAKTGTLSDQGVSTEAGVVTDADGRLLVFVFVANGAPEVDASRAALDSLASTLATCGCH
jgi:serine-type D-Ala-D-Ala carboxypeptidase/endopeptidase (penicillin-binding protein 4)